MHVVDWEQAQEGYATIETGYYPQGVPGSRSRDRTGQDVLLHLQQSSLEQGPDVHQHNPKR